MEIRWTNVAVFGLLIVALVVYLTHDSEIGTALSTMKDMGKRHDPEAKFIGMATFGFCMVCLLAAIKIFLNAGNEERKEK